MFRTIRTHWKKSIFAVCAITYGSNWMYDRYQSNQIRKFYCEQAAKIGSQTCPSMSRLNRVAVLLNGSANNGKAKSIYDKTIYPLLHLTGLDVRVYRLDAFKTTDELTELLTKKIEPEELNALVIVGGDGTLSQLGSYLFESKTLENLPICVVPIGERTSFARQLFPLTTKTKLHEDLHLLCESVFALFNGTIVRRPLLKISLANEQPIYATTFDFGHYSRLEQLRKRLWYFSYLKYPISAIYLSITNPLKSVLSSSQPTILYKKPCQGCTKCRPDLVIQPNEKPSSTYFSRFYQTNKQPTTTTTTPSTIQRLTDNPECGNEYCLEISSKPKQLSVESTLDEHSFQLNINEQFQYFSLTPKQTLNVQRIRFNPDFDLIRKHLLINNEKYELKMSINSDLSSSNECQIELTDKKLKFLQINPDYLLMKTVRSEVSEEDLLEKKGIFLFPRRQ